MKRHLRTLLLLASLTAGGCTDMGSDVEIQTPLPSVLGIHPDSAAAGDTVTISGANFGPSQGSSGVTFPPGVTASVILSWSNDTIVVVVPAGATSGSISVSVGSRTSNGIQFISAAPPDTLVHFQTGVLPILLNNCAIPSCHSGSNPTSQFNASTYAGVRKGGATFGANVVIPFDSTNSQIMHMIRSSNNLIGLRMPQGGPYAATGLPDSLIVRIGAWIHQGALNN
ncbi:MAG TPA: IPT/TIG domain-containing protein [Bacteroidota bacterium]|nr:IPT/TIG domain-containing protein [Bacteroidota bacterium]